MFKFTINNIECTQGIANWQDLKISIKRDVANRIVRIEMPQEMTFTGECYEIIKDVYDADGYCAIIPVTVSKEISTGSPNYKQFFTGLIFINECEFDDVQKTVVVPIRDNSFVSRINNNRDVEFNTETDITKNGVEITPIAPIYISMYNPSNGVVNSGFAHTGDRGGYDWLELINIGVKFITDDELSVVSDWYTNLADADKILIMQGIELRTATHTYETFFTTFNELTADVFKGYNLWMTIEGSTIRIEEESYFFNTTSQFSYDEVGGIKRTFAQEFFYSNVLLGSATSIDSGSFPIARGVAFVNENYFLGGKCNIRNTLDLKFANLITDGNLIQDILINDTDTYDDELFIIQYTASTTDATKGALPFGTARYYNLVWVNVEVFDRYNLSSGGFVIVDSLQDKFRATATIDGQLNGVNYGIQPFISEDVSASLTTYELVSMLDESTAPNFDNNARFFSATNLYNVNQTGLYSFYFRLVFEIQNLNIVSATGNNKLNVYMRSFTNPVVVKIETLLADVVTGIDFVIADGTYTFEGQIDDVFLVSGDTYNFPTAMFGQTEPISGTENISGDYIFKANSYIECIKTPTGGGIIGSSSPDTFKASIFTFDKKLTQSQVDLLLETPYKAFTINNKKLWANEITINLQDNVANIEAISDIENSG